MGLINKQQFAGMPQLQQPQRPQVQMALAPPVRAPPSQPRSSQPPPLPTAQQISNKQMGPRLN